MNKEQEGTNRKIRGGQDFEVGVLDVM